MKKNLLNRISDFIIDKKIVFFLIFFCAVIYCALSVGRVKVNDDIKQLLPEGTDTRRGLAIMKEEFTTFASAEIMISGVSQDGVAEYAARIGRIDHVFNAAYDPAENYKDGNGLITVMFDGETKDEGAVSAMKEIRELLKNEKTAISTEVGSDFLEQFAKEMIVVLIVSLAVVVAVLLFTSRSFFEVFVIMIVLGVSVVLNMGTNFWLGEISTITNSVAVILQLALSIDYAIIFCHRFQDEYNLEGDIRRALGEAHSRSVIEVSSSSLTTISGLAALTLMQFRLGFDLGIVLIKSIVCSMLTVFLLMPGLIMVFHKPILRTRHKNLVPDVSRWGGFLANGKPVFLIIFILMLPCVIYMSAKCEYTFSPDGTDRIRMSEQDKITAEIRAVFPKSNMVVLIAPNGNYVEERSAVSEIKALPGVKNAVALADIEAAEGIYLTDKVTAADFSRLSGADITLSEKLFKIYSDPFGLSEKYDPSFSAPLIDVLQFAFTAVDAGLADLDAGQSARFDEVRGQLEGALLQLKGEKHSRMVFTVETEIEGDKAVEMVSLIDRIAKDHFGEDALVIGDITSARDLRDSFKHDNPLVTSLTIIFVFLVLFFTFRSFGAAVILILVIQGSIWLNFSFPFITGTNLFFVTNMIVSAIQMGATIDYAIVVYNRYRSAKEIMPPKEAMRKAVNDSFSTIITSGVIMSAAGFIVGYMTTDVYVGSIGLGVGRGALTSVLLVMTVLPQVILYGDRFIEKTTFSRKRKE
ncbi:MAG: MMPL family transporter [Clostridia bacterium]|nr:MMPL family transporter [Clostridia bacterium]